jgi:hypothetical protein
MDLSDSPNRFPDVAWLAVIFGASAAVVVSAVCGSSAWLSALLPGTCGNAVVFGFRGVGRVVGRGVGDGERHQGLRRGLLAAEDAR